MEIQGECAAEFAEVRKTFEENFTERGEVGASVAITVDGETVVDLWGGEARPGVAWERDTIVNVYSTTKTMAGLCVLMCADRGLVDLDAPVATYWPGFEQNGKEGVLVKHVMSHSAGLSVVEPPLTGQQVADWDLVCERLAAQAPAWAPGTASGYHAVTQGFLQGEIVRRVTGRSLGTFFREEVAIPLGADFWIGLPASEDDRVADLIPPGDTASDQLGDDTTSIAARTFLSVDLTGNEPKERWWRAAEIPAAGGIGNARSVGRVHSAMACGGTVGGVTLLSKETVERILEIQTDGDDLVMGVPIRFGMGYGLPSPAMPIAPGERAFFWGGWGGSIAIVDLDSRMTVSYVMNKMESTLTGDLRGGLLAFAAFGSR